MPTSVLTHRSFYRHKIKDKTPRAKKSYLTRHANICARHLARLQEERKQGAAVFMDEPIMPQIADTTAELAAINQTRELL